jgi:ABC-type amino acid transport substrate-binding protein
VPVSTVRCLGLLLGLLLGASLASGCGLTIPADPEGTLERVKGSGVLRAGASPRPGWVEAAPTGPRGREVDLVEGFAASLGAEVAWTTGGEEHLVSLLEQGRLDVAVGGVTDQNPWVEKVALTRPYVEVEADGTTEAHVMMTRMGENAFLSALERWLDDAVTSGDRR